MSVRLPSSGTPFSWRFWRQSNAIASLASEGFIHFSFADQVAGSANRHFADAGALVAVEVAAALLDAPVVVEDSYGGGTEFPHLYGPLQLAHVLRVDALPLRDDGAHDFSGLIR